MSLGRSQPECVWTFNCVPYARLGARYPRPIASHYDTHRGIDLRDGELAIEHLAGHDEVVIRGRDRMMLVARDANERVVGGGELVAVDGQFTCGHLAREIARVSRGALSVMRYAMYDKEADALIVTDAKTTEHRLVCELSQYWAMVCYKNNEMLDRETFPHRGGSVDFDYDNMDWFRLGERHLLIGAQDQVIDAEYARGRTFTVCVRTGQVMVTRDATLRGGTRQDVYDAAWPVVEEAMRAHDIGGVRMVMYDVRGRLVMYATSGYMDTPPADEAQGGAP